MKKKLQIKINKNIFLFLLSMFMINIGYAQCAVWTDMEAPVIRDLVGREEWSTTSTHHYAYYNDRHQAWNKPQFGRSKNPEGRNIPKEIIKEKGKGYISLAFTAFDQNRIDLKDLSDFLGIKLSYISKTRQLLNG